MASKCPRCNKEVISADSLCHECKVASVALRKECGFENDDIVRVYSLTDFKLRKIILGFKNQEYAEWLATVLKTKMPQIKKWRTFYGLYTGDDFVEVEEKAGTDVKEKK